MKGGRKRRDRIGGNPAGLCVYSVPGFVSHSLLSCSLSAILCSLFSRSSCLLFELFVVLFLIRLSLLFLLLGSILLRFIVVLALCVYLYLSILSSYPLIILPRRGMLTCRAGRHAISNQRRGPRPLVQHWRRLSPPAEGNARLGRRGRRGLGRDRGRIGDARRDCRANGEASSNDRRQPLQQVLQAAAPHVRVSDADCIARARNAFRRNAPR